MQLITRWPAVWSATRSGSLCSGGSYMRCPLQWVGGCPHSPALALRDSAVEGLWLLFTQNGSVPKTSFGVGDLGRPLSRQ